MKHSSASDDLTFETLAGAIAALNLSPADYDLHSLTRLLAWLHPSAVSLGLTNYRDLPAFTSQLVLPALYLLTPALASWRCSPLLDFGAGSGAVGLALATLLPESQVVLADRRQRVVQFVDLCVSRFRLSNCSALLVDLANPPPERAGTAGTVLIRAYGPPEDALSQALFWAQDGGSIALWHQPPAPDPPHSLSRVATITTSVPALALTIYRRNR